MISTSLHGNLELFTQTLPPPLLPHHALTGKGSGIKLGAGMEHKVISKQYNGLRKAQIQGAKRIK